MAEENILVEGDSQEQLYTLYSICSTKDGRVFVIRTINPKFCFSAENPVDAVNKAEAALDKYEEWKNNDGA